MADFDFKKEVPSAFPVLNDRQIKAVAEFAECKTYRDGEVLFRAGETDFKFHVIKSGAIDIIDRSGGAAKKILTHEAGEFTGDLSNLTGRTSNVDAIASGETDVLEVCEKELHQIISEKPELSDLILQTFITRARALSENSQFTGLRVIGSRFSTDTFRIRDFLSKNHALYTYFDFAENDEIKILLKTFRIEETDLPVVGYGQDWLLKNPSNEELAEKIGIKREIASNKLFDLVIVGAGVRRDWRRRFTARRRDCKPSCWSRWRRAGKPARVQKSKIILVFRPDCRARNSPVEQLCKPKNSARCCQSRRSSKSSFSATVFRFLN